MGISVKEYKEKLNQPGQWVFVVPISGLILTDAVNNEFQIKRVLFIGQKKLPRVRKRLGITRRISAMPLHYQEFFASADTFAVLRHSGKPNELRMKCIRTIKDELSILALSQLGYSKRRSSSYPSIKDEVRSGIISTLFLSEEDERSLFYSGQAGKFNNLGSTEI